MEETEAQGENHHLIPNTGNFLTSLKESSIEFGGTTEEEVSTTRWE